MNVLQRVVCHGLILALATLLCPEFAWAQEPAWGVPVGERRVSFADIGEGEARRLVLENGFLRAVINPSLGGRIESLVHKRTGQDLTLPATETIPGGLLADQVWQQSYWHSDWNRAPYAVTLIDRGPEKVEVLLKGEGRLWTGVSIAKQITLAADECVVRAMYTFTGADGVHERAKPDFWIHNGFAGGGRVFMPSPVGVVARPVSVESESWVYDPTRGWMAYVSDNGAGLACSMEFERLLALRSQQAPIRTAEWLYRKVHITPETKIDTPVTLAVFSGLERVDGMCDQVVAAVDIGALQDNRVTVSVKIAPLQDIEVGLEVTTTDWADGGKPETENVHWLSTNLALKVDTPATREFTLPPGRVFRARLADRAGKLLLTLERELPVAEAEGAYAMAPESERIPDVPDTPTWSRYKPTDLNFNSLGIETPHVKWARPYVGGRPRVLALLPGHAARQAVDLAQRFDMDLTAPFLTESVYYVLGDRVRSLPIKEVHEHLEKVLEEDYDVILTSYYMVWPDLLTPKAEEMILEKVRNGAGLVITARGEAPDALKGVVPLEHVHYDAASGPWVLTDAETPLLHALPFDALPASYYSCSSRLVKPEDGAQRPAPEILLMTNFPPPHSKHALVTTWQYGEGRIVQLYTGMPLVPPANKFIQRNDARPRTPAFDYWEYHYAMIGRLVYWAAKKESPVTLQEVKCVAETVTVTLTTTLPTPVQVRVRVRDEFGAVLNEQTKPLVLRKGQANTLSFDAPADAGMLHLADVFVTNPAGTLAFGAGSFPQLPPRITKCEPVEPMSDRGGNASVKVTLLVEEALPAGAILRGEVFDGYGRKSATVEVPAAGPETTLDFPLGRAIGPMYEARVHLVIDGKIVDQNFCEGKIRVACRPDLLRLYFWGGVGGGPEDYYRNTYLRYQDFGIGANMGDKGYTLDAWMMDRLDMAFNPPATGMYANRGVSKEDVLKEPDKLGCWNQPEAIQSRFDGAKRAAETWKGRNVMIYGCGDENRGPGKDICFCKICRADMVKWMQENYYPTLADLNREWQTDFKTWNEVMPMTEDEAKAHGEKTGSYAPWVDHRQFNKWSYARLARAAVEGGLAADPTALVGASGTAEPSVYDGRDWWLIGRAYNALHSYNGMQTVEQMCFNPEMVRYTWTGYGKPLPIARMGSWTSLGLNNRGYGVFASRSHIDPDFTLCEPGRGMRPNMEQASRGPGQMLVSSEMAWEPIYLLQSPASIHGAYITGQNDLHGKAQGGVMSLMHDIPYTYRAISYEQLGKGQLGELGVRVLLLPHMVALSEAECRAIRDWVNAGGTVIADLQPGIMTKHGRMLSKGQLDDLFGLDRSESKLTEGKWQLLPAGPGAADVAGGYPTTAVETGLKVMQGTDAKPLWTAKSDDGVTAPAVYHRAVGKGHAWYLAFDAFRPYRDFREEALDPEKHAVLTGFQGLIQGICEDAGVKPSVTIWKLDAKGARARRLCFAFAQVKDAGDLRYVMVNRDYYIYDENAPDHSGEVAFDRTAHVYDVLYGTYLGRTDRVPVTFTLQTLRLFALLPYRVDALRLDTAAVGAHIGRETVLPVHLDVTGGPPGLHWFRVDVTRPDGAVARAYSGNLKAPGGQADVRISFAQNDPTGSWKVRVQDVATGKVAEAVLLVGLD